MDAEIQNRERAELEREMGFTVKSEELVAGEEGTDDPRLAAIYLVGQAVCERLETLIILASRSR
jgi:hypothetical protein